MRQIDLEEMRVDMQDLQCAGSHVPETFDKWCKQMFWLYC